MIGHILDDVVIPHTVTLTASLVGFLFRFCASWTSAAAVAPMIAELARDSGGRAQLTALQGLLQS